MNHNTLPTIPIEDEFDEISRPPAKDSGSRKPRISRTSFLFLLAMCAATFIGLLFMFSPIFNIETVIISGNFRVSEAEILERLGVDETTHLLLFNANDARSRIMENLYIGEVEFERVLGRLYVYITERRLTAYVEHMPGSFLYLDEHGRVLEVRTYFHEPFPVLVGLQFTRFQLGEILEVPDAAAFSTIVLYAQLLNHHGLIYRVSHINVADSSNISIVIENTQEFNVGGADNADEKIRTIIAVLETMPHAELFPGFMDISEIRRQYFFEMLQ